MPRIESITPHQFAGPILGNACTDCGDPPTAPQHWNVNLIETLGPYAYHHWYYNRDIWRHVSFMGVYSAKNVLDLWNYQEIMWLLKPGLVVEFGTYAGGTSLYLGWVRSAVYSFSGDRSGIGETPGVLSVDVDGSPLSELVSRFGYDWLGILCIEKKSVHSAPQITEFRQPYGDKPLLVILDSDHSKANVLAELEMLRELTRPGDYVIVEDSNINGHPVLPDFGPGPWEAIREYEGLHPGDYEHDTARELKFGMTFNPRGYLRRR